MFEVIIAIGVFIGLLLVGVPVAFAIITGAITGVFVLGVLPMEALTQQSFAPTSQYSMLAIPFFILTAELLFSGKLGGQVIGLATRIVGRLRGGVGMTNVLTNVVFSGVSGSAVADATGIGKVMIPWTKRIGYPAPYASAVNASSAVLGVIIPPSIPMILFAAASGVSVAAIFNAGIGPGILMAVVLMFGCWIIAWRNRYPQVNAKLDRKKFLIDLLFATPAILVPVILIRVALFTGMATVTEVSVLAVVYAVLVRVFMYRDLTFSQFVKATTECAAASAVVLILIMFSSALAWLLTIQEAPQLLSSVMVDNIGSRPMIIAAILLLLLIVGMFLDMSPAILLLTPVLMPLASAIDMDPIHLGIIMIVTLALGLYTPPVGTTLYISAAIGRVSIVDTTRMLFPFYGMAAVVILICAYAPGFLWIPN